MTLVMGLLTHNPSFTSPKTLHGGIDGTAELTLTAATAQNGAAVEDASGRCVSVCVYVCGILHFVGLTIPLPIEYRRNCSGMSVTECPGGALRP